jgi:hypothetical protein
MLWGHVSFVPLDLIINKNVAKFYYSVRLLACVRGEAGP